MSVSRKLEDVLRVARSLRVVVLAVAAAFMGAVCGFVLGVATGLAYTQMAAVSSFEGYAGLLVFLTFGGGGAVVGALAGVAIISVRAVSKLRGAAVRITRP